MNHKPLTEDGDSEVTYLQRVQNLPPLDFQAKFAPHVSPEFGYGALESCGNLRIAGPAVVWVLHVNEPGRQAKITTPPYLDPLIPRHASDTHRHTKHHISFPQSPFSEPARTQYALVFPPPERAIRYRLNLLPIFNARRDFRIIERDGCPFCDAPEGEQQMSGAHQAREKVGSEVER